MQSKIRNIMFKPTKTKFALGKNSLDLRALSAKCKSRGIVCKDCSNHLSIRFDDVSFNLYASGSIGFCMTKKLCRVEEFDERIADFFWKHFVSECIKTKELI